MIPEDLQYSDEHEWIRADEDVVTIGITDYAQDQLGDIVYVQLPEIGDRVSAGSVIGELESTKSVSDLFSPIDGQILSRNDALDSSPDLINSDPYGEGWLLRIRPAGDEDFAGLLSPQEYTALTTS